jgi:hypothetical protein
MTHKTTSFLIALGVSACASTSPRDDAVVVPVEPAATVNEGGAPFAQELAVLTLPVDPATLGPPVSLSMQSYTNSWRAVISVDPAGRAAIEVMGRSGDLPSSLVLPFSEPVAEVHAYGESNPMFCARTTRGVVECLMNDVQSNLRRGTLDRLRAFRITPPRPVATLEPGYALCYALDDGARACWQVRRTSSFDRLELRAYPVRPRRVDPNTVRTRGSYHAFIRTPAEVPETTCVLEGGEVTCRGVNAYGTLGHGAIGMDAREGKVAGLSGVTHVISGDHYLCALDDAGLVSCWGEVPRALLTGEQRRSPDRTSYPSCPVDLAESKRIWEERTRDEQARADASAIDPPCQEPDGPCALPLDPMPVPHTLEPIVEAPCVAVAGFEDRWPTPEELDALVTEDTGVYAFTRPVALPHLGQVRIMAIDRSSPAFEARRLCFSTHERRVFCLE